MIIDFRTLDDGVSLDADLCIVGAGAAGISLAHEFLGTNVSVCLLESGGTELDGEIQALYEGETAGMPYFDLATCRLRFLGGSTNHWAGWCRPMDEADFEDRPWVSLSGWPIRRADLDAYYKRALPIFELGPMEFEANGWSGIDATPPAFDAAKLRSIFWQFSPPPVHFGDKYRDDLEAAPNIRVLLHASVVDIETDTAGGEVTAVGVRSLDGRNGRVRAKAFVLACGGIENARILLAANSVEPAGIGNRHGIVGRYFMEHPNVHSGIIVTRDPQPLMENLVLHFRDGVPFQPGFAPSVDVQREHGILNASIRFAYEPDTESGTYAFQELWHGLKDGRPVRGTGEKIWQVLSDIDDVSRNVYRKVVEGKNFTTRPRYMFVACESEQMPNPDSRITLIPEKDALGMNKVRLDWRLTELDRRTVDVVTRLFAEELGRTDLARFRLEDWLQKDSGWGDGLQGSNHHMGTTRMADDPRQGVVDRDCRVHGVSNLFVAGSSVFPTGGFATPTFTIVALALRLADHLKTRYG